MQHLTDKIERINSAIIRRLAKFPLLPSSSPSNAYHAVHKSYVDALVEASSPRSYLAGLTLSNNSGDTNNDIDIAAGFCRDSTNSASITLAAALTKRSDASWAVGTGNGGMDTGAKPNSGTLHVWIIKRSDTGVVDVLFSTSASSPTMPSGYDIKRRIGSCRTDSSGNIFQFVQTGDDFYYKNPSTVGLDINVTAPGTSAVLRTLSVPSGIKVKPYLIVSTNNDTNNDAVYLSDPDCSDVAPSNTASPLAHVSVYTTPNDNPQGDITVWTNTSSQIRSRHTASGASNDFRIQTLGWMDYRGRFD